jgi:hypothetical protein
VRSTIPIALVLVAVTVTIHAVGLAALLRAVAKPEVTSVWRVWAVAW